MGWPKHDLCVKCPLSAICTPQGLQPLCWSAGRAKTPGRIKVHCQAYVPPNTKVTSIRDFEMDDYEYHEHIEKTL